MVVCSLCTGIKNEFVRCARICKCVLSAEIDSVGVAGSNLYIQRNVAGVVWTGVFGSDRTSVVDKENVSNIL